ncbi:hypothetical protein, partial [Secundilactobacillus kimchicus]
ILPALLTLPLWILPFLALLPFKIGKLLGALLMQPILLGLIALKLLADIAKFIIGLALGWFLFPLLLAGLLLGLPLALLTLPLW